MPQLHKKDKCGIILKEKFLEKGVKRMLYRKEKNFWNSASTWIGLVSLLTGLMVLIFTGRQIVNNEPFFLVPLILGLLFTIFGICALIFDITKHPECEAVCQICQKEVFNFQKRFCYGFDNAHKLAHSACAGKV